MTDSSTQGIKTVLHPVSDLATAKAVYAALLGVQPQVDDSYYVGFEAAGQHIGLVPGGGPQGMTSPVAYWHVPDLEAHAMPIQVATAHAEEPFGATWTELRVLFGASFWVAKHERDPHGGTRSLVNGLSETRRRGG